MPKLHHLARISIVPLGLALIFSIVLLSLPLLSSPRGPGRAQQIGWQSWDIVRYPKPVALDSATTPNQGNDLAGFQDDESDDSFAPSLPLDTWDPLKRHTTGITEIAAVPCMLPPWLYPSMCGPKTSPEEDKALGKWVRVERDLNWKTGLWYLNVYYRRTRRFDAPLITDLLLLQESASPPWDVNLTQYTQAHGDFRDGVWPKQKPLRLWYKTKAANQEGKTRLDDSRVYERKRGNWWQWDSSDDTEEEVELPEDPVEEEPTNKETTEIITELDVLYGDQRPFFGFDRVKNGPIVAKDPKKHESVDLVFRRGNPLPPLAPEPRFHKNGTFKIMQIADLHYSVSDGACRDTRKSPCVGDVDTAQLISEALDVERPDLVVFSGDQLNGQGSSWDSKSVIAKFAAPVIDREINFVAIFGNHDSEIMEDRAYQMKLLQSLPYSLAEPGPADVAGVGNYLIKIRAGDASHIHLFTLYFLDSHANQQRHLPWQNPDYDFLKQSQIDWFRNESAAIKSIERPFTPDSADDLGKIWRRAEEGKHRLSVREGERRLAKPNAMMFFHIPIAQSYGPVDADSLTGDTLDVGTQLPGDGPGNSKTEGGMFEHGLLRALESEEAEGLEEAATEVKVIGHGHSHNTDKCRRNHGIWACFGGGGSYSGYGNVDFERRFRIYQLKDYGETIETYKRTESGHIIDREVLVGEGAPSAYQPRSSN